MLAICLPLGLFVGTCAVLGAQIVKEFRGRMRKDNAQAH
jgi:hypothetical protein